MMKQRFLICLLLATGSLLTAQAQPPRYWVGDFKVGSYFLFGRVGTGAGPGGRIQSIYYPSDFPAAPSGKVPNLYLRIAGDTGIHANFAIKMGYTSKMKFNTGGNSVKDTFITNLITVFSSPGYSAKKTDTPGTWIKIPLQEGNFLYDKTRNFAVEVSYGPPTTQNGFSLAANHINNATKSLTGFRDSAFSMNSVSGVMDFGFDVAIAGVGDVSNITSFGLFPNPGDGRFNITFDTKQAVKEARVTVTNAVGQQVFTRQYDGTGSSFFKEIDLHDAAKGVYFVEVMADGERVVRRVVIQ